MSAEIPYWWCVATQIWVALPICFRLVEKKFQPIRSATQIWVVSRHQYGIFAPVPQMSFRGKNIGSIAKCHLFPQAMWLCTFWWFMSNIKQVYMYYIFLGIYPHGVARWPVGHTNSTVFVIGHLKTKITYIFAVSYGIRGKKSFAADITPAYGMWTRFTLKNWSFHSVTTFLW